MKQISTLFICLCSLLPGITTAQYCPLTTGAPYSTLMPGIVGFTLNTISRTSANIESSTGTVVNTGLSTTLTKGQSYTVAIKHSEDGAFFPGARNNLRIWIDYNIDGDFLDANETVLLKNLEAPNTTYTGTFTIPYSAVNGATRMRVTAKMSADAGHSMPTPCDSPADPIGYHGEMEDYTVNITGSGPTAYCDLQGLTPYSPGTPGITNFKIFNINRTSQASESSNSIYVNTGLTTTLAVGNSYAISITHNKDVIGYPTAKNNLRIWLDMNSNFLFDDVGETLLSVNQVSAGIYNGTITIPASATIGSCRMRVMVKQGADAGNLEPSPCNNPADPQGLRGEAEDYNVVIAATPPNLTGISEVGEHGVNLLVYPNPAADQLTVLLPPAEDAAVSMELFDITGKNVGLYKTGEETGSSSTIYSFHLKDRYAPGIYNLKVTVNETVINRKVVIGKTD